MLTAELLERTPAILLGELFTIAYAVVPPIILSLEDNDMTTEDAPADDDGKVAVKTLSSTESSKPLMFCLRKRRWISSEVGPDVNKTSEPCKTNHWK